MKRENIFLIFGLIMGLVIFVSVFFFSSQEDIIMVSPQPSATLPERYPVVSIRPDFTPPKQESLPVIPQSQGGGIDVKSQQVRQSTTEINKLTGSLPYLQNLVLTTGQTVDIAIPGKNLQLNAWTLTVQIFGIDYQSPENTTDYAIAKSTFLEAANKVFAWMESKGADPNKIIISWGDRQFIQERAEKWLSE